MNNNEQINKIQTLETRVSIILLNFSIKQHSFPSIDLTNEILYINYAILIQNHL